MRHANGQALIECVVFLFTLAVFLAGLYGFTVWFAVRQKLLLAAKEGALLYSSGRWTHTEVEARMRDYLITKPVALHPSGVHVHVGKYTGKGQALIRLVYELDESVASYTPPSGWHYLLGSYATISEKLVVRHAPEYWMPLLGRGPAIAYGS